MKVPAAPPGSFFNIPPELTGGAPAGIKHDLAQPDRTDLSTDAAGAADEPLKRPPLGVDVFGTML